MGEHRDLIAAHAGGCDVPGLPGKWQPGPVERPAIVPCSPGVSDCSARRRAAIGCSISCAKEPFQEPTWADLRRRGPTLSHCRGRSSAQLAFSGHARRRPGGDWGSRGRRFKSGRPDQKVQVRRGSGFAPGPFSVFGGQSGSHMLVLGFCGLPRVGPSESSARVSAVRHISSDYVVAGWIASWHGGGGGPEPTTHR